jgi:hypothetical protein
VPQERLDQVGAADHVDLTAVLALERTDLLGDVAAQHGRVVPVPALERPRRDVLRHGVELARDGILVADQRPVGAEDLVRPPPEQQRLAALGVLDHATAELLVGERHEPAPVFEPAARVLVRRARRLHHAVQGHEGADDELAHALPPRSRVGG